MNNQYVIKGQSMDMWSSTAAQSSPTQKALISMLTKQDFKGSIPNQASQLSGPTRSDALSRSNIKMCNFLPMSHVTGDNNRF